MHLAQSRQSRTNLRAAVDCLVSDRATTIEFISLELALVSFAACVNCCGEFVYTFAGIGELTAQKVRRIALLPEGRLRHQLLVMVELSPSYSVR